MSNKKLKAGIQEVFVKTLKELVPPNVSLVDEIADILGVSTDSVYRRLRGETDFSLEEIYVICKKYPISIA
jgi:predicted transcriptional regulator